MLLLALRVYLSNTDTDCPEFSCKTLTTNRAEMTGGTGWWRWIVLYQLRLLHALPGRADLAGAVGDCLDRLVLADLQFWEGREAADVSSLGNLSSLYHHRWGNIEVQSNRQPLTGLPFRASEIFQIIKFPRDFSVVTEERWSSCKVKRLQFFLKQNSFEFE